MQRMQFLLNMSECVSCLGFIYVNDSFTHILTFCCCSYADQWIRRDMCISSSEKKVQFKESSSVKVHKWVSFLAILDVNNSFTHILTFCCCSYADQWIRRDMRISSGEKKVQFKKSSSIKVHKWACCLAIVDVNNSFTHIHNPPLLLLIHWSMDQKGHAHKLWWEQGTF